MIKLGCDESLPSKWRWVEANDVMDVRDGTHDSPKAVDEGIPLVTSKNLVGGKIDFSTCNLISMEDHESISKRSSVDNGDILYAMIGTIGNPVIVEKSREFSIKNVALFKFTKSTEVYNRYIYHFLNSKLAIRQFQSNSRGGTQKFVSLGNIRSLQIPLPPLYEQKRIAAILDKADAIRRKRQQAINLADDFLRSVFLDMFGDPRVNPKCWTERTWGEVLKIINGKNQKTVLSDDGQYPIMGSGGEMGRATDYLSPENSIIIGRKGNINKPILVREKFWNVDTAFGLVADKELLSFNYLYWFCIFFNFEKLNKTVTIPSLTKADLLEIKIPIPDIELQHKFDRLVNTVTSMSHRYLDFEKNSSYAFSSLSQKAFAGEL